MMAGVATQPVDPSRIVVFTGPTLTAEDARAILPALYLPPARSGDILVAMRLHPRVIVLIDGRFETTAAVWHKELLYALHQGVAVFGVASMGALRAAELAACGMIGAGAVFEAFRDGTLTGDDEVAVRHNDRSTGYRPLSEALVNIRATVEAARQRGIIASSAAEAVIRQAKRLFYPDRTLAAAAAAARADVPTGEIDALLAFAANGGAVDRKGLDARALLHRLATEPVAAPAAPDQPFPRTVFFRKLLCDAMCRPFGQALDFLPPAERIAVRARARGAQYQVVQRLASLLAVVEALSRGDPASAGADPAGAFERDDVGLGEPARQPAWWEANDLDPEEAQALRARVARIIAWVTAREETATDGADADWYWYLLAALRIYGEYPGVRPPLDASPAERRQLVLDALAARGELNLYVRLARLWAVLDRLAVAAGFDPPTVRRQRFSDDFRRTQGLGQADDMLAWLHALDLDVRGWWRLIADYDRLTFLCDNLDLDALAQAGQLDETVCWLHDALRLTGLYTGLKAEMLAGTPT